MKRKIVDYYISAVSFDGQLSMAENTRKHIQNGWQPMGGICVTEGVGLNGQYYCWYYQAMVKYAD